MKKILCGVMIILGVMLYGCGTNPTSQQGTIHQSAGKLVEEYLGKLDRDYVSIANWHESPGEDDKNLTVSIYQLAYRSPEASGDYGLTICEHNQTGKIISVSLKGEDQTPDAELNPALGDYFIAMLASTFDPALDQEAFFGIFLETPRQGITEKQLGELVYTLERKSGTFVFAVTAAS